MEKIKIALQKTDFYSREALAIHGRVAHYGKKYETQNN